jgi:hypothetical protein
MIMSEIPSADDIRKMRDEIEVDQLTLDEWLKFTQNAVANYILQRADDLNNGRTIEFSFPVLRDMGEYQRIWRKHHPKILEQLREKGYLCKANINNVDVPIKISITGSSLI